MKVVFLKKGTYFRRILLWKALSHINQTFKILFMNVRAHLIQYSSDFSLKGFFLLYVHTMFVPLKDFVGCHPYCLGMRTDQPKLLAFVAVGKLFPRYINQGQIAYFVLNH